MRSGTNPSHHHFESSRQLQIAAVDGNLCDGRACFKRVTLNRQGKLKTMELEVTIPSLCWDLGSRRKGSRTYDPRVREASSTVLRWQLSFTESTAVWYGGIVDTVNQRYGGALLRERSLPNGAVVLRRDPVGTFG